MRRAVGHGRKRHLDRLGPLEQPQAAAAAARLRRARAMRPASAAARCMLRGRGQHRAFGNVRVLRQMHDHAAARRSAPRCGRSARRVRHCHGHGCRDRAAAAPRSRCGWRKAGSGRSRSRDRGDRRAHRAARETGGRSPQARVTGWPVSTRIVRTAPSVRKKLASSRRAPLPCFSIAATSVVGEPRQRRRDHGVGRDRLGKALLDDVIRQRLARADRRIALPQRLLQHAR